MPLSLLLLLGLLGLVGCNSASDQKLQSSDEGPLIRCSHADWRMEYDQEWDQEVDGCKPIVEGFLETLRLAIIASDKESIESLVAKNFYHKGCKKEYNRNEAIKHLLSLRNPEELSFNYQTCRYINSSCFFIDLEFKMTSSSIGKEGAGRFILDNRPGTQFLLVSGDSLDYCEGLFRPVFNDRGVLDAHQTVHNILDWLKYAILLNSAPSVEYLVADTFRFYGCKEGQVAKKEKFAKVVASIPNDYKYEFEVAFILSYDENDTISAGVKFVSSGITVDAEYVLEKKRGRYYLESGRIQDCPNTD